jgi:TerC family integral membrane protein
MLAAWIALTAFIVIAIAVDLHSGREAPSTRSAVIWSIVWTALGVGFAGVFVLAGDGEAAGEYLTGFLIEKTLSLDNLFVFAVILSFFAVPTDQQRLVIIAGIALAIVLRAIFILLGATALNAFEATTYLLGALLVVTAVKIGLQRNQEVDPAKTRTMRLLKRLLPLTDEYDGSRLTTKVNGGRVATPLLAALITVGAFDLMFAIDSIPAIFAITRDTFVVFAANAFSLLGMVSLYFVLDDLLMRFRYLNVALAAILGYVGAKLLLDDIWHPPVTLSLAIIVACLAVAAAASVVSERRLERSRAASPG